MQFFSNLLKLVPANNSNLKVIKSKSVVLYGNLGEFEILIWDLHI